MEAYDSSRVEVLGKFLAFLRWKGKIYRQLFFVTTANGSPNFLSQDGCYVLGVVKPGYSVETAGDWPHQDLQANLQGIHADLQPSLQDMHVADLQANLQDIHVTDLQGNLQHEVGTSLNQHDTGHRPGAHWISHLDEGTKCQFQLHSSVKQGATESTTESTARSSARSSAGSTAGSARVLPATATPTAQVDGRSFHHWPDEGTNKEKLSHSSQQTHNTDS